MKRLQHIFLFFLMVFSASAMAADAVSLGYLRCELLVNPEGIGPEAARKAPKSILMNRLILAERIYDLHERFPLAMCSN